MAGRPIYGAEERTIVVATYRLTRSSIEAAKEAGVSVWWAQWILRRGGMLRRRTDHKVRIGTEAVALYRGGLSIELVAKELAKKYSPAPSREWIRRYLKSSGVTRSRHQAQKLQAARRFGRNYDDVRRRACAIAEEKLWSAKRIARFLGVSEMTIRHALISAGHVLTKSEGRQRFVWQAYLPEVERRRAKRAQVFCLRGLGKTYAEIADETGLSESTVGNYLRHFGMKETRPA